MLSQNIQNTNESQQPLNNQNINLSYTGMHQRGFSSNINSANKPKGNNNNKFSYEINSDLQQAAQKEEKQLQEPPNHLTTITHNEILQQKAYKDCYPFTIRIENTLKNLIKCGNKDETYVTRIQKASEEPIKFTDNDKTIFEDKIIELRIEETTQLELNKDLVHPFIRVHFVDIEKGNYISKKDQKIDSIVRNENITWYNSNYQENEEEGENRFQSSEWKQSYCDYIPAVATNCCDLRIHGNAKARWNETILINEDAMKLCDEKTIILFEMLDFNAKFLRDREKYKLDKDNFYRVAWGFLRPIGLSGNHFGKVKIQLYKYVFNSNSLSNNMHKSHVPLVYFDFIWQQKKPYNGQLIIYLNAVNRPQQVETSKTSQNLFQVEKIVNNQFRKSMVNSFVDLDKHEEPSENDIRKNRRRRNRGEKCYIPDKFFAKFTSASLGCFRLEFSHNGRFLAAACTEKDSRTCIKFFEVEDTIDEVFRYRGHTNLIHEITWSENDQYMASCSSDFTTKIWAVPYETNDKITEEQSEQQFLVATLNHPSYVYSVKFHPKSKPDLLIVVTACFDAKIRIFYVNPMKRGVNIQNPESFYLISTRDHIYDNFDNLLKHRHPNSICFDRHGRLFAGDSLGSIHVFDLNNINDNSNQIQKLQTIEHQSIEGDPINQVHFINSDDLIVHSRDNCIRKFTIKGQSEKRVAASYIGSTAQKFPIHSRVSPSNEYILSGSEDGKPFLWDISGNLENTKTFEYDIQGALSDVAWSESYHMVAVAGFGSEFPIIVYYYEKMDNEVEQEYYKLQDQMDLREQREQKYDDDDGAPFLHDDRRV